MKTLTRLLTFALILFFIAACQKGKDELSTQTIPTDEQVITAGKATPGPCNPNAYTITLESREFDGTNWVWTWSVLNSNPGNGNNGTIQDLSHWGMQFGSCFVFSTVVSAAYSGNGVDWTSFTPTLAPDGSQSCLTTAVLKFDFGTNGAARSYYRLVISENYPPGTAAGYYKSGSSTGCCNINFIGVGCTGGPTEERSGK